MPVLSRNFPEGTEENHVSAEIPAERLPNTPVPSVRLICNRKILFHQNLANFPGVSQCSEETYAGLEVLTEVVIFSDISQYIPLKVYGRFGGTYLYRRDLRIRRR
jgi:hypothetical protein